LPIDHDTGAPMVAAELMECEASSASIWAPGTPRIFSRLRTEFSAVSADVRSAWADCQSCRLPPLASYNACLRVSLMRASFTWAAAVLKSFCA
jgi:hypothetical protein